jgi:hypothetical protein
MPSPANLPADPAYTVRANLFAPRKKFILHDGVLGVETADGAQRSFHLADLLAFSLEPRSTAYARNAWQLNLKFRSGKVAIVSHHFNGVGDFTSQADTFGPFVAALKAAATGAAPQVTMRQGYGRAYKTIMIAMVGVLAALALLVPVLALTVGGAAAASCTVAVAIAARPTWTLWRDLRANW